MGQKPFIARDTKRPLVIFGGYEVAEDGGLIKRPIVNSPGKDYGADPLGDGRFRMVPSGDIVDLAERMRRLS